MITIAILRAAGISETLIARVAELEEKERLAAQRERWRTIKRNQRSRPPLSSGQSGQTQKPVADQTPCPPNERYAPSLTVLLPSSSNLPSIDRPLPTAARAKRPLPADWEPKGEQRDVNEADEFRDHARAKGYQYVDWDAAYRNFQKSPYNARNKGGQNGQGRRHGSILDAGDRLREKLHAQGSFADQYVPGSSGPTPLRLDHDVRAPGLRLIPKG